MDTLLGLVVLTSPLFLIIAWLPISIWLTRKLVKWIGFKNGAVRLAAGLFGFVLVFMLPFADEIAGRVYFNHLCATEAGVKVYQTVELPAEYWDGEGRARFYVNRYDHEKIRYIFSDKRLVDEPRFKYTWVTRPYSQLFHIDRDVLQITDREKNVTLGEYFLFRYWGGWLARNFSPHNSAASCEAKDLDSWPLNIFKPATSTR